MDKLRPPSELCLQGNISENWKKWWTGFELFLIASGISEKPGKVQCATFLHLAGQGAQTVHATLVYEPGEEKDDLETLRKKFQEYCEPKKNLTFLRHRFFSRKQGPTESFDSYLTDIKTKAKDCEFGDLSDSLLRDRIVCGIRDEPVRLRLLREADIRPKAVHAMEEEDLFVEEVHIDREGSASWKEVLWINNYNCMPLEVKLDTGADHE